jgi:hypothetical protein
MTWKNNPTSANIFVVVAVILSVWHLADFIFYDRHVYDLFGGIGFGLWAYGTYRNGNRKLPEASQEVDFSKRAYYVNAVGFVLVLVSLAMRFWR